MESHIKLKDNNYGSSIATYTVLLFGLTFILYLFGYTSVWNSYLYTTSNNYSIIVTDPVLNLGINIVSMITSSIEVLLGAVFTGAGLIVIFFFAFRSGVTSTLLTFLVPALILVVLNIFVFPYGNLTSDLNFANAPFPGYIITLGFVGFFNVAYILAVIEFIRGPS